MPIVTRASVAAVSFAAASSSRSVSPDPCVSPKPSDRKATAMFRKRQRDWRLDDEEFHGELQTTTGIMIMPASSSHHHHHHHQQQRHHRPLDQYHPYPYHPHQRHHVSQQQTDGGARQRRRLEVGPMPNHDWSSAKHTDHENGNAEEDDLDAQSSPFKDIQSRVDQVGEQVAQARRDVAELRALLLRAVTTQRTANATTRLSSTTTTTTTSTSQARVRIDMLCS